MNGVIELIRERARSGSRPGARVDRSRLGLVIEGGSMRGVFSGGAIAGLEKLGLLNTVDAVYGTSAGAIAGAYFIAGQARFGTSIYLDAINNRRFINPARLLLGRPMLDVDFVVNEAVARIRPLCWRAVLESAIPLVVVASSLDQRRSHAFRAFRSRDKLFAALRASATMAFAAGAPAVVDGQRYFDGNLLEPIPLPTALADGCTHVLVVLNQPFGRIGLNSPFDRYVVAASLNRHCRGIGDLYLGRVAAARATMRQIASLVSAASIPQACVLAPPADARIVSRTETGRRKLAAAAVSGMKVAIETLSDERPASAELYAALSVC